MSWSPKAAGDIPKIIAGPILRKVTPTEVSVFIVTKDSASVQLKIYDTSSSTPVMTSSSTAPRKLGNNVYVTVVTASSSSAVLSAGTIYGYNLFWGSDHLGSNDVLVNGTGSTASVAFNFTANSYTIGSSQLQLPTFVLPPNDIDDLWILHGSCRKPHGEGYDAMEGVYAIIEGALTGPNPDDRPHMLFLTGDQIYADDVADALLQMLIDTADELMGWSEETTFTNESFNGIDTPTRLNQDIYQKFSNSIPNPNYQFPVSNGLKPGLRNTYAQYIAKISAESKACKSHLLEFREFVMMYLFAWSDILWPTDTNNKFDLPEWNAVKNFDLINNSSTPISENSTVHTPVATPDIITINTIPLSRPTAESEEYQAIGKLLGKFHETIGRVRKAIANVPVYMILDDHEVTDDLFYNFEWDDIAIGNIGGTTTSSNAAGRRLLTNGLAAYAIFQAWGNTPEQFASGQNGAVLLNKIESIVNDPSSSNTDWTDLEDILLPSFNTATSLGYFSSNPSFKYADKNSTSLDWSYRYSYSGLPFEVIAFDTRTMRSFRHGDNELASYLSDSTITRQFNSSWAGDKKELTIIITPSPILEAKKLNEAARYGSKVDPTQFLENKIPNNPKLRIYDVLGEAWSNDTLFLYTFLFKLLDRTPSGQDGPRVVVLSGDVHYSYTKRLEMLINTPYRSSSSNSKLVLASLCASSFKNENETTRHAAELGLYNTVLPGKETYYAFGYNNYSRSDVVLPSLPYSESSSPAVIQLSIIPAPYYTTSPYCDWVHKTKLIDASLPAYTPSITSASSLANYDAVMEEFINYVIKRRAKLRPITGDNNMGELIFSWGTTKTLFHNVYERDDELPGDSSRNNIELLLSYEISLDFHSDPADF